MHYYYFFLDRTEFWQRASKGPFNKACVIDSGISRQAPAGPQTFGKPSRGSLIDVDKEIIYTLMIPTGGR